MLFPSCLLGGAACVSLLLPVAAMEYIKYTTVTGYFLQDDPTTNASTFDYTATNFGLINRTYDSDRDCEPGKTQWQRFEFQVSRLNRESGPDVDYKVLFMGRHGQGYHNVAESYYGTPAWNCYWSLVDGNGTIVWADAHLTPTGVVQALIANAFWASEIKTQKIPIPETYYTSPLSRCLGTANLTFTGLDLPRDRPFVPTIKEFFRETISGHTCDRRIGKAAIHAAFPTYRFEHGFAEDDELWQALHGETDIDQDIRSKKVLDNVFSTDRSTWISITSHSGEIGSILQVLGHQPFGLNTGAVIPVLVRAKTVRGRPTTTALQPYTTISTCATAPPTPTA